MAAKTANPITLQELHQRKEKPKKPVTGTGGVATRQAPTKTGPDDAKAALAKEKLDKARKLKEQKEEERKKKLEEKRAKEQEKAEAMAERRKAMEEKRKQELSQKSTSSVPAKTTAVKAARPAVLKSGTKPAVAKPTDTTDGAKSKLTNKTTLSTASAGPLAEKKPVPSTTNATTVAATSSKVVPNGGTSALPQSTKKTGTGLTSSTNTKRPAMTGSKPASSKAPSTSSTRTTKTTTLTSKSASSISSSKTQATKPAVKSSSLASSGPRTSATASKQSEKTQASGASSAGVKSSLASRPTIARTSKPAVKTHTGVGGSGDTGSKGSPGSTRPGGVSKAAVASSPKTRIKKPADVTSKASPRSPLKSAVTTQSPRSGTKVTPARGLVKSGAGPVSKTPTRMVSDKKQGTKKSPTKGESGSEKRVPKKADSGAAVEKEKKIEEDSVAVAAEENKIVVGNNEVPERNVVPEVSDMLILEGTEPHPATDATSTDMVALTPTTAQRAGEIISSQTSLSKELQFKLPRVGEVLESESKEREIHSEEVRLQSDATKIETEDLEKPEKLEATPIDLKEVAVATISTNLRDLPENFSAQLKLEEEEKRQQQEEEREERKKRVDEIMERTRAKAAEMDLMEGKVEQTMAKPPSPTPDKEPTKSPPPPSFSISPDSGANMAEDEAEEDNSPSPTLPIIPESLVDGSRLNHEPLQERGTISAQDSFEFEQAYDPFPVGQPPMIETVSEEYEVLDQAAPIVAPHDVEAQMGTLNIEEPCNDAEMKTEEPVESEYPPSHVPQQLPSETFHVTESGPEAHGGLESESHPEGSAELEPVSESLVPVLDEQSSLQQEIASPPPLPVGSGKEEEDFFTEDSLNDTSDRSQKQVEFIHEKLEEEKQEEEEAEVKEEEPAIEFEDEEATSDVLMMLPEDADKEMQQMLDDTAQRIQKLEESQVKDIPETDNIPSDDAVPETTPTDVTPTDIPLLDPTLVSAPPPSADTSPFDAMSSENPPYGDTPINLNPFAPVQMTNEDGINNLFGESTDLATYSVSDTVVTSGDDPPKSEVPTNDLFSFEAAPSGEREQVSPPTSDIFSGVPAGRSDQIPPPEVPTGDSFSFDGTISTEAPPPPISEVPTADISSSDDTEAPPPPTSEVPTADIFSMDNVPTEEAPPPPTSEVPTADIFSVDNVPTEAPPPPTSEVPTGDIFSLDGTVSTEAPPPPTSEVPTGDIFSLDGTVSTEAPPPPTSEVPTGDIFSLDGTVSTEAPPPPTSEVPTGDIFSLDGTVSTEAPPPEVPTGDIFSLDGTVSTEAPPPPISEVPMGDIFSLDGTVSTEAPPPPTSEVPTGDIFSLDGTVSTEAPPPEVPTGDIFSLDGTVSTEAPPPPISEVPMGDIFSLDGAEAPPPPTSEVPTGDMFSMDNVPTEAPPPPTSEVPTGDFIEETDVAPPPSSLEVPTADLFPVDVPGSDPAPPLLPEDAPELAEGDNEKNFPPATSDVLLDVDVGTNQSADPGAEENKDPSHQDKEGDGETDL